MRKKKQREEEEEVYVKLNMVYWKELYQDDVFNVRDILWGTSSKDVQREYILCRFSKTFECY